MLSDFIEAGIDSLKIEGRMKSNLYIATTTHAYAQALKELKAGKKEISSELFTELTRIKHRDYTLGSLGKPADETSIYLSQERNNTDYDYAGTVLEVNQKENSFAFFTRNKLTKGSLIEVIPFNGETIEVKTDSMKNVSGQELDVAQANTVIWLPLHKNIQSKNVARFNSKYLGS